MILIWLFLSILTLDGQLIEFVAYGDWGAPTQDLKDTIDSIKRVSPNRVFNLLLGDNFYPGGVSSVDDPQFDSFTNNVLGDTQLMHYMLLGNIDYLGSISAQIEFSQVNEYWYLPSAYYRRMHVENGITVCLIMIDTTRWDSVQVAWIEEQLKAPECYTKNAWTIVSGHYPIWSSISYSDRDNLKSDLVPLLHKYGVQLYLSGHEHLQDVFFDGSVVQVTSGAVSDVGRAIRFKPHPLQIWGMSGPQSVGYLRIRLTRGAVDVDILSSRSDESFESFSITRGGSKESMFGHINWKSSHSNVYKISTDVSISKPIFDQTGVPTDSPKTATQTTTKSSWSMGIPSGTLAVLIYTLIGQFGITSGN